MQQPKRIKKIHMDNHHHHRLNLYGKMGFSLISLISLLSMLSPASSLDFLLNSFSGGVNGSTVMLVNDAEFDSGTIRLTNDFNPLSLGRFFHTQRIRMITPINGSDRSITSFSTSFVFSVLPAISTSPGFGLCFVLTNATSPPGALASQYFGLFSNATSPAVGPLFAVKFDTGRNTEFADPDGNHIGINLNYIESSKTGPAGYFNSSSGFIPVPMRDGSNVRAWIDFDGEALLVNVTVAPVNVARPSVPTLSYRNPAMAEYLSEQMFIGFSASITKSVELQRVLAWSFSDTGSSREINTTNLPVFLAMKPSSSVLSPGAIAGISVGVFTVIAVGLILFFLYWRRTRSEEDEEEDWEKEYWPHRFSGEELTAATAGFSAGNLIGSGGFGKVYKGVLPNGTEIAVKCVNHDSKQGVREFMAEISSMGRLQHKNLVQMRGWCRKGNLLMLVYDFMPNGSLNRWIFDKPKRVLEWDVRWRVLADVAEGLSYLHHGYDQVVLHRDIKSGNILLDSEKRARLGDFGLAKLYGHGEVASTTRVVGTLGYLAPELATVAVPTAASDVFSFGVVVLEVVCGRRPIDLDADDDEAVLVDWVRGLYVAGKAGAAADRRLKDGFSEAKVEAMLKLGLACCHPDPLRRPSMREVVPLLGREGPAMPPAEMLSVLSRVGEDVEAFRQQS